MGEKKYYIGIDVGSISTDIVALDDGGVIVFSDVALTGAGGAETVALLRSRFFDATGSSPSDIAYTVACGYGREKVTDVDRTITEITCHAKGAHACFPDVETIVDIGGEDTKAIRIDSDGNVRDFVMNNKCAAGTGRFLEAIANRLGCDLPAFIAKAQLGTKNLVLNNTCTVFAESEVVSLLAEGEQLPDVARAVHRAIAKRIFALLNKVLHGKRVILTGGVAKNTVIADILRTDYNITVHISESPQIIGALGAALFALKQGKVFRL